MVKKFKRQIAMPSVSTGVLEVSIFCIAFLATGVIGLHRTVPSLILPMVLFAAVMMISMIVTGVYRDDISHSIVRLYKRTALGYGIGAAGMLIFVLVSTSELFTLHFVGFVLMFSFFMVSTVRPVIVDSISTSALDRRAP
ncbi:hypothetical protein Q4485_16315 [Granulosicoccaceae sp. 1_MG-2023]|nr:hypothetical protein [Granulosicoccaceae sp. 1_MG-2023]